MLVIRISQDLAKDLAMLAREIHDVAGEIDSVSPAATDPGALVVKHHQILRNLQKFHFEESTKSGIRFLLNAY